MEETDMQWTEEHVDTRRVDSDENPKSRTNSVSG